MWASSRCSCPRTFQPTMNRRLLMLARSGERTPPTMLQTTLLGAFLKRGWTHAIHDADLLLVDLDLLHQSPNDLPPRRPVRLFQLLGHPPGKFLQLADHQPQFRL